MFNLFRRRTSRSESDHTTAPGPLHAAVARCVAEYRPLIRADGGDITLVSVTDAGVVRVRLHGACVGCPAAQITLHQGLERYLRERIAEVRAVECG